MTPDWRTVVCKLHRKHGTYRKLGACLGMSHRAIANLAQGAAKSPTFDNGVRLLAMYSREVEPVAGAEELAKVVHP